MTSNERSADRWERLRPRNWSLAFKLIAVLVVPVLLAQALLVLRIVEQVNQADRLGGNDRYVTMQDRVSTAVGQLQRERDESVRFVAGGRAGDRSAQKTVFGATDTSIAEARTAIGDPASLGTAAEAYRLAQEALGKLPALRTQVTDSQAPVMDVLTQYTAIVAPVMRLESAVADQLRPAEPNNLATALQSLSVVGEQIALQHAVISASIIGKQVIPQQADLVRAADVRLASTVDELNATLAPDQRARYASFLTTPDYAKREQLKNAFLSRAVAATATNSDTTTSAPVAALPALADWDASSEGVLTAIRGAEGSVRSDLRTLDAAQQENAKNLAGIYSVILLLATVLGTTLLVLVWRTLLKSLRTLRGTALDVAQRKLPQALQSMREGEVPELAVEPVPVTTSEEIGQVARAFDAVHSQAVRLAAEQATLQAGVSSMFVNLSRRSQGLVERQLQLIEQLESNEQDPDQLANLFQLDHLATRMRRNSESLLVLAGSEANRRAGQPVPVIDVLRAAVSEVEQYQRIVVQPPPPVKILGRTAADLVHLLAELLDNATNFSAPDTQVVMSSTRTEDGSVLIEIADRGVGMATNELAEANDRLSGPTTVDVSASRRMGLFVVGRLASRHGIGVRLGGPPAGTAAAGVTASVSVPSYLVPLAEGAGTGAGDGARVGAGAPMPEEQMAGNGASGTGSLQSLVTTGSSRSASSGVGNGHGGVAPPDL
ncbi:MAG: histidine kinase, partial [Pseudonocardia sp.]|nr:histidine kinase [Pseudonocardia sp.]